MQRKGEGYQRVEPLGYISYLGLELVSTDLKSGGRTSFSIKLPRQQDEKYIAMSFACSWKQTQDSIILFLTVQFRETKINF